MKLCWKCESPSGRTVPFSRGVNFPRWFEAPSAQRIDFSLYTEQDFAHVKSMGADVIRLPVKMHPMTCGAPDYTLDPQMIKYLDIAVDWAESHALYIIIDNHSFHPVEPTDVHIDGILLKVWAQIAEHFKNRSDYVVYEVLNEPHGISDERWGEIQGMAIDTIRAIDAKHAIIVGGTDYNSIGKLAYIPEYTDSNLIYTFGYGTSHHAQVLYFNKRLFREAGIDPNLPYDMQRDGTWTWDNYINICKKLTRDTNNDGIVDTYAMTMDVSTEILDAIASSNGASYVAKDASGRFVNATGRPEFIEALQFAVRLRDEGVMMPRPENSAWDWYKSMFMDGKTAIRIEPQYLSGAGAGAELQQMRDEWGMVMFPKGPKAKNYVVYSDENIIAIPSTYSKEEVDRILQALSLWYAVIDENWKSDFYSRYRDTRAVDETVAYIRNPKQSLWKNFRFIPGLERGDIAWYMWYFDGQPAQLVESVSQPWNALINDANK